MIQRVEKIVKIERENLFKIFHKKIVHINKIHQNIFVFSFLSKVLSRNLAFHSSQKFLFFT